ncbi:MAG: hypothetical protein FWC00_01040 [Firmicutes bacterium]|nr:hypothetical protein [Bacillota bacterium]
MSEYKPGSTTDEERQKAIDAPKDDTARPKSFNERIFGFTKNITPRMAIIWAVSFVVFLIVGFGTASIVMVAIPRNFGHEILKEDVFMITYRNANANSPGEMISANDSTHLHYAPMAEVLNLLHRGSRTNVLADVFRGRPRGSTGWNNGFVQCGTSFESSFAQNSIVIEFARPVFRISPVPDSRTEFEFLHNDEGERLVSDMDVFRIYIPLREGGFGAQRWYLATTNPNAVGGGTSFSLRHVVTVYGNYTRLWDFVRALDIH